MNIDPGDVDHVGVWEQTCAEVADLRAELVRLQAIEAAVREVVAYDWQSLERAREVNRVGPWKKLIAALDAARPTNASPKKESNG